MSQPSKGPKVDPYEYWDDPPPQPSPRLRYWLAAVEQGWKPNLRLRRMPCATATRWYGVYRWEYLNVLAPKLRETYPPGW